MILPYCSKFLRFSLIPQRISAWKGILFQPLNKQFVCSEEQVAVYAISSTYLTLFSA